jgi:hypothetical protein
MNEVNLTNLLGFDKINKVWMTNYLFELKINLF